MTTGRQPQRTCLGCRGVFSKDAVVRIVAGPEGAVIDYREKLPGRAAYVCPRPECIRKALAKETLSRALHANVKTPAAELFIEQLAAAVTEKVRSLLLMAERAGMLATGASAVDDALQKGRIEMLIFAEDLSEGTKQKLLNGSAQLPDRQATMFSRDEMGRMFGRELIGIVGIIEKGFANAVWSELERLKGLRNTHR
ncbi:MAG: DUF448 domain-containing protein [Nitrospirota bacterium]